VVDRLLKSPKGLIVAQVADVLAHERLAVNHQSDRVLEIGAESENRAIRWNRSDGAGRIAPRTAQNGGSENAGARHRIVHAPGDGSLAYQESVGDSTQPVEGVGVNVGDWLAGAIRAGHDQNIGRAGFEEQMVERRV